MKKREGIYIIFYMRACVKILILLKTVQLYIAQRESVYFIFQKAKDDSYTYHIVNSSHSTTLASYEFYYIIWWLKYIRVIIILLPVGK